MQENENLVLDIISRVKVLSINPDNTPYISHKAYVDLSCEALELASSFQREPIDPDHDIDKNPKARAIHNEKRNELLDDIREIVEGRYEKKKIEGKDIDMLKEMLQFIDEWTTIQTLQNMVQATDNTIMQKRAIITRFKQSIRIIARYIWKDKDEELKEHAKTKYNGLLGDQIILQSDQVILAVTFGQAKITGKIDKDLLELALKSLNRIDKLNRLIWNWDKEEATYYIETMKKDLIKFKEDFQK